MGLRDPGSRWKSAMYGSKKSASTTVLPRDRHASVKETVTHRRGNRRRGPDQGGIRLPATNKVRRVRLTNQPSLRTLSFCRSPSRRTVGRGSEILQTTVTSALTSLMGDDLYVVAAKSLELRFGAERGARAYASSVFLAQKLKTAAAEQPEWCLTDQPPPPGDQSTEFMGNPWSDKTILFFFFFCFSFFGFGFFFCFFSAQLVELQCGIVSPQKTLRNNPHETNTRTKKGGPPLQPNKRDHAKTKSPPPPPPPPTPPPPPPPPVRLYFFFFYFIF